MDILIKGMEMPKEGYHKVYIFSDGRIEINGVVSENRIVALPSHGRLIDADALLDDKADNVGQFVSWATVVGADDIRNAPVIVEASK